MYNILYATFKYKFIALFTEMRSKFFQISHMHLAVNFI